jgi:hypothetical protein
MNYQISRKLLDFHYILIIHYCGVAMLADVYPAGFMGRLNNPGQHDTPDLKLILDPMEP